MRAIIFTATLAVGAFAAAIAFAAPARAGSTCAAAVIQAWHEGRLDGSFAPACYRQALGELPEDIRIYSSAQGDINRALIASLARKGTARHTAQAGAMKGIVRKLANAQSATTLRREAAQAAADPSASAVPLTVLVSAAGAVALVGAASVSVVARRLRRGQSR